MKKITFTIFLVALSCIFAFSAFATDIKTDESFYVYTKQTEKVCEILSIEENALKSYCEQNNVTYFAVDNENKRQIKLFEYTTDFSNSIVNISSMTSDNISALIPQIVGIENAKGDVIEKGAQKFIKTSVLTRDSGGEYILTSFTTVANRKNYVLSFYTLKGENTDYIDEIFEDYAKSEEFLPEKEQTFSIQRVLIFIGVVVFLTVFVLVGLTVIKDLKKSKEETEEAEENEETE